MATLAPALLLLAVLAPSARPSEPACKVAPAPSTASVAAYATAVVDALGQARRATDRLPGDGPQDATAVEAALGRARADFACACKQVAPFARSETAAVRASAASLLPRCESLRDATGAMATALGRQAAAAGGPGAEAARAGMDRAIGTKDRAWSEFLLEAAEAVGAVVEMHGGEPTGKLRVTRAERAAIRARLEKEFGNDVRGPPGEEQEPLLLVATGWYRILGDPLYRAADEGATDPAERAPAGSAR